MVRFVVFDATFNNISVECRGNRNTRRKPPTCRNSQRQVFNSVIWLHLSNYQVQTNFRGKFTAVYLILVYKLFDIATHLHQHKLIHCVFIQIKEGIQMSRNCINYPHCGVQTFRKDIRWFVLTNQILLRVGLILVLRFLRKNDFSQTTTCDSS